MDYVKVSVLVLLMVVSILSWILAVGSLDSAPFISLGLMFVGTVTGILAKLWIYGKN